MEIPTIVTILVALVLVWAAFLVIFWAFRPKGVTVREFVGLIPDILRLLRSLIVVAALARRAPRPRRARGLDPVADRPDPEFIPVLGPMDDVVVAVVAIRYVRRRVGSVGASTALVQLDAGFDVSSR